MSTAERAARLVPTHVTKRRGAFADDGTFPNASDERRSDHESGSKCQARQRAARVLIQPLSLESAAWRARQHCYHMDGSGMLGSAAGPRLDFLAHGGQVVNIAGIQDLTPTARARGESALTPTARARGESARKTSEVMPFSPGASERTYSPSRTASGTPSRYTI